MPQATVGVSKIENMIGENNTIALEKIGESSGTDSYKPLYTPKFHVSSIFFSL